jgi:hypothetical protein
MTTLTPTLLTMFGSLAAAPDNHWVDVHDVRFDDFGGEVTRGDSEMDTDKGDRVPVSIRTELYVDSSGKRVMSRVVLIVREHGGDRTEIRCDFSGIVYEAPPDTRILDVRANGGLHQRLATTVVGKQHGYNRLAAPRSAWESLNIRVDSKGRDDQEIVGVRGELAFQVLLDR